MRASISSSVVCFLAWLPSLVWEGRDCPENRPHRRWCSPAHRMLKWAGRSAWCFPVQSVAEAVSRCHETCSHVTGKCVPLRREKSLAPPVPRSVPQTARAREIVPKNVPLEREACCGLTELIAERGFYASVPQLGGYMRQKTGVCCASLHPVFPLFLSM
jgi:hypothetical protein